MRAKARAVDEDFVDFATSARARLRRTAYVVCGDWDTASDLTQEALLRTYVAWRRIEHKGGALSYARRCVVTIAIDQSRRRGSSEVPTDFADATDVADLRTGHEQHHAERDALHAVLAQLGPRQRACVALRFLEDLSVAETAAVLGCSEGTVKSQTARALGNLRGLMAADLPLGGTR